MIEGILLINKEVGITSYGVIRKLKKVLPKGQKIGHAGTLDPFASGLLVILLGKSTKLMQKILDMEKEYIVKAEFGYATDTQDITGEKVYTFEKRVSKEELEENIESFFVGNISQIPPIYSAKKIKGKKAYEYAREKKEVELKAKNIEVKSFELTEYDWPFVTFGIVCGSGTYIRTLVNDLGIKVGTYATAVELERVRIGKLHLEKALNSKDITEGIQLNLVNLGNE